MYVFNAHDTIYTDQTGVFPVTSCCGNKYVMVMCEVDSNHIDEEPMNSQTADSLVHVPCPMETTHQHKSHYAQATHS
jgi:hypothetical protein